MADRIPTPPIPGLLERVLGQPRLWPVAAVGLLAAVAAGAGRDVPDELFNQLYVT